jgi:hypothetical protein
MQAAASVPPLHLSPQARDKYRLNLRELRLSELHLCQVSCLQGSHLERRNPYLVRSQVRLRLVIRRRTLSRTSSQRRHPAFSSAILTADLADRLALAAGSDHAPGETRARHG